MLWAMVADGRSHAWPGLTGACPTCFGEMIPKCGSIVT